MFYLYIHFCQYRPIDKIDKSIPLEMFVGIFIADNEFALILDEFVRNGKTHFDNPSETFTPVGFNISLNFRLHLLGIYHFDYILYFLF